MSLEPSTVSEPVTAYREIPAGSAACTVCDEIVEHLSKPRPRVGERRHIKQHGARDNRCPGGGKPGKTWLEASRLPVWDELSDIDKGNALMFVWKCHWEKSYAYARDNYPATFTDQPVLRDLPRNIRCQYAKNVCRGDVSYAQVMNTYDVIRKRLGDTEFDRLYNLALDARRAA